MGQITWNTDVNAPCCPGEILAEDGRSLLIQTDWDYCGTANSFGWSIRNVQRCADCGRGEVFSDDEPHVKDWTCENCGHLNTSCDHDATDGTVSCKCGLNAGDFMEAAYDWLRDHDGATADDPGYFPDED